MASTLDHIGISIHALRKESDLRLFRIHRLEFLISIHALRKESDMPFGFVSRRR